MVRAVWAGSLSFGLVHIPVRMVPATRPQRVRFHLLDRETRARIRHQRVSAATGEEVPYERLVKGYEVTPDHEVVLTREELVALDPEATRTIAVAEFVPLGSIDPRHHQRAYYLVPDRGGDIAYALLVRTMREAHRVAIARMVLRTRQHLVAVRPLGDALCLETLLYADELVPPGDLGPLPDPSSVGDHELAAARQLLAALSSDFDPARYHDDYRERVLALIARKAEDPPAEPAPASAAPESPSAQGLLETLRASLPPRETS